jgi:hypothetical protein
VAASANATTTPNNRTSIGYSFLMLAGAEIRAELAQAAAPGDGAVESTGSTRFRVTRRTNRDRLTLTGNDAPGRPCGRRHSNQMSHKKIEVGRFFFLPTASHRGNVKTFAGIGCEHAARLDEGANHRVVGRLRKGELTTRIAAAMDRSCLQGGRSCRCDLTDGELE